MGRDFARKARRKTTTKRPESSGRWIWLFSGVFLGILASSLVFFKLFPMVPKLAHSEAAPEVAPKVQVAEEKSHTPRFDFYSLLPELEVPVTPPPSTTKQASAAPLAADTTNVSAESTPQEAGAKYRLQLASFKSHADADRLKAQMALLGIELEIETVTLGQDDIWYRVRSAPYADLQSAESARAQLQAQAIQSMVLKQG